MTINHSTKIKSLLPQEREALYYQALEVAWQYFIEEEKRGLIFTEVRLKSAIEAARTLYKPFKRN